MNNQKAFFEFHGQQMDMLFNLARDQRNVEVKNLTPDEQKVEINRDIRPLQGDEDWGVDLKDNDYSD